jgi:hypothetical protein
MNPTRLSRLSRFFLLASAGMLFVGRFVAFGDSSPDLRAKSHGAIPGPFASSATDLNEFLANKLQTAQQLELLNKLQDKAFVNGLLERNSKSFERNKEILRSLTEALRKGQLEVSPTILEQIQQITTPLTQHKLNSELQDFKNAIKSLAANGKSKGAQSGTKEPDKNRESGSPSNDQGTNGSASLPARPSDARFPQRPVRGEDSPANPPWVEKFLEIMERNEALRNSAALQQLAQQIMRAGSQAENISLGVGESSFGEALAGKVAAWMPSPEFWTEKILAKVEKMPLPSLPALPNVKLPKLDFSGKVRLPGSLPRVGWRAASRRDIGVTFLVVVGAALVAVVSWQLYQARRRRIKSPAWAIGQEDHKNGEIAIPADFLAVATREDVIRAFEYLSLLKLGARVSSWNHRHIAAQLGGEAGDRRQAAQRLAAIYEQARYAPEGEALPESAVRAARCELSYLAGAPSA